MLSIGKLATLAQAQEDNTDADEQVLDGTSIAAFSHN